MDATQVISDSILESDEEENEEENQTKRRPAMAKLCILKNPHIPEAELPLFLGDNVLGRDPSTCTLPFPAPSVSKQHATICISVYRRRGRHSDVDMEALVWDLGSMNGTRKGRLKLTPNVRYALSEGDSLVVADIPCQYVSCATDSVSSQDGTQTPGSRNSGAKAGLPDALGEKWDDTSTGGKMCANSGAKSLKRTAVRGSCLAFERTPPQPQGTLVPESDSDSDSERWGEGDKKQRTLVSDSHKSSSSSSAFSSPANRTVPESDSESPIAPSSSNRNGSHRHVSFNTEEPDVDVRRQLLEKKNSPVGNDEEEERAAQERANPKENEQHVKLRSSISLTREGESLVSTPEVSRKDIPAFNMDSDTDVEGEEEKVVSAGPPNTVLSHMDSDTDVDEDKDASEEVPKSASFSDIKPSHSASAVQPEDITMDSDTDAGEDDTALSDAATTTKVTSFQSTHTADSASSALPRDFHLDSDTDVDEEAEGNCGAVNKDSKADKAPTESDIKLVAPESVTAAPHSLHLDSDTDDKVVRASSIGEPSAAAAVTKSCAIANADADLDILSDSDTDMEDVSPLVIPAAVTSLSVLPGSTSEALKSDSDADTDVDESSVPSAGKTANPADLKMDSDTDVEGQDADIEKVADDQMPDLHRENTPRLLFHLLQKCSTPVQVSGVEEIETQAFASPSSGASTGAAASGVGPAVLSSCSDSQGDEDFIVAETKSSTLPSQHCHTGVDPTNVALLKSCSDKITERSSREDSFRLGLSDSSHLQPNGGTLATESTQAFVSGEGGVNLEDTQAYAAISTANRTSAENDSNLEATQAYGEDEEPVRNSEMSKKDSCVDLALEATQAYILESCSNPEDDSDENKTENPAVTDTCLTSSTLAMAETQPAPSYGGEESLETNGPVCPAQQVEPRTQETEERDTQGKASHLQQKQIIEAQSVSETQPMCTSHTEESDDEDSIPGPRKRRAKSLQLEEEQTQPLAFSQAETQPFHISVEPTQPMVLCRDSESDEEESMLLPRKRNTKQRHFEEEQTQQFKISEVSIAETQPSASCEDDDSEPMSGPRKRKAKPLQIEDETQSLTNSEVSAVESQPLATCESKQSDEDDLTPCVKKRRAKPLQLEEEQTQPLITSEVSGVQTQPAVMGEDEESDDDSVPGPRKRKAKQLHIEEEETQQLTNSDLSVPETQHVISREAEDTNLVPGPQKGTKTLQPEEEQTQPLTTAEVSPVETQPIVDEESDAENSIPHPQKRKAKQLHLDEEDTQPATNSEVCTFQSPLERETAGASETSVTNSKEMRERGREEEEAPECSVAPKRQTKGKGKTVPSTRGRGGKAKSDDGSSEVEMKQTKRRKNTRQQEDDDERKSTRNEQKEGKLKREEKVAELRQEQEETTKERRETEEQEKLQAEDAEKIQLELERVEREKREDEEKLRLKKEREEKEKLEREEKEKIERERKEQREKERLEAAKREEERLEREAKEQARLEREEREKLEKGEESKGEEKPTIPARGRRANRRTVAAQGTTEPAQDLTSTNDDFPARRTRSRSNSSNSVSSERSALDVSAQESKGKGRGRDAKRGSETPQKTVVRSSRRRTTMAAGQAEHDSNDNSAQELLCTSNSSSSVSSEMSSCSVSTQNRGRGGRQRGRGRKTEPCPDTVAPAVNETDQTSAKRGRNGRKAEESSSEALHEDDKEKVDSQRAGTSRGQQRASTAGSEHGVSHDEGQSNHGGVVGSGDEKSPLPKRNCRGRGQKAGKPEPTEDPVVPTVSDGDGARNKRKGRKSELEPSEERNSAKVCKGKERAKRTEAAEEGGKDEPKEETPDAIQVRKTGRASTIQTKENAKETLPEKEMGDGEKMEVVTAKGRARGRTSVIQKNKKEVLKESGTSTTSTNQDTNVEGSQPQTPTSGVYRKRQAPPDSSPVAKTPRSSSASPSGSGRLRAESQAYKVLFTGLVDEAGERVLARLGGAMAKGVSDMNCLVTDKVRRTVKFLCAVAKGIPVVTTDWLEKSGKAGSFLSPNSFIVKDPEQEKKFSFCLQESLRTASSQPLLQGYEIHVTKSVKPEPVNMKDIISSSGATFLPRMPSSHKAQTVVISCEEDWRLCGPAVSATLPVVTAEFILTGILQQKLDFKTHALSPPAADPLPAGGRGRGRRKI